MTGGKPDAYEDFNGKEVVSRDNLKCPKCEIYPKDQRVTKDGGWTVTCGNCKRTIIGRGISLQTNQKT